MFVYIVLCDSAGGRQLFVFDTRKAAESMCKALRVEGRDPWILTESVKTEQFVKMYGG